MNVTLTPEQEQFIADKIKRGDYQSPDQILRQGIELLRLQDELVCRNVEQLRKEVDIGIGQADRGETVDGEEFFHELLAEIRAMKSAGR